jgi:hypothetical protein
MLDAPIEIYEGLVQQLRKFNSDNYENQLLFDEKLEDNILSVYMNYIEPRYYVYELYKDGNRIRNLTVQIQDTVSLYWMSKENTVFE